MGKQKNKGVSVPPTPLKGDHGTGTRAAKAGTRVEPIDGKNPNHMGRRRRVNVLDEMGRLEKLSPRQYQAAKIVESAYCRVQMLSSGSPLKERVQAQPLPDKVVAQQVDAQSRLEFVMRPVPSAMRYVVEHVCWHNQPIRKISSGGRHQGMHTANLKVALDLVANRLRF